VKLLFFNDFKLGVLKDDTVVDVTEVVKDVPRVGPQDLMAGLIANFGRYRGALQQAVEKGSGAPLSEVKVRPPLPKPGEHVRPGHGVRPKDTRPGICVSRCSTCSRLCSL